MTSKRIAHDRQQKSDKSQESGILQRAAVRLVADAGMQSTDDQEAQPLSNSAFSKDFSQVPISTTKPEQFQARNPQSHLMPPIQAKLTIGEPGDRYEQEADRVASKVVQRINTPSSTGESVQREAMPDEEDELQMKPLTDSIQRVEIDDEEELQMKSLADSIQRAEIDDEEELQMKSQVQRQEPIGGGEASTDLESAINSARGGGQSLDAGLQRSIGQAMGADFSGVKVHTDAQSDQLNQSIQARAFTTGQDVFFRQGEYNPGSRGGQELIAHELTHVVQQSGGAVQRSLLPDIQAQLDPIPKEASVNNFSITYQMFNNPGGAEEGCQFGMNFTLNGSGKPLMQLIHPAVAVGNNTAGQWNIDNHNSANGAEALIFPEAAQGQIVDTPKEICNKNIGVKETIFTVYQVNIDGYKVNLNGVRFGYKIDTDQQSPRAEFTGMKICNLSPGEKKIIEARCPNIKYYP